MAAHTWQFILTNNAGAVLGEVLNASEIEVSLPLSRIPTASLKVRLDNPQLVNMAPGTTRLKAYRDGALIFHGPLISVEMAADALTQTVAANFAGAAWYLTKRLVGVGSMAGGYKEGTQIGNATGPIDRIDIARFVLGIVNAYLTHTGIVDGSAGHAASAPTAFGPVYHMPASDAIAQLAASDVGFDWEVIPTEPTAITGGLQIGLFHAEPLFGGGVGAYPVFEYGGGRSNIVSFNRTVSADGMMNQGYIQYPGFPDTSQVVKAAADVTSINTYGQLMGVVDGGDLAWDQLRQELVNAHVAARKRPRIMFNASFARDSEPTPFLDFNNGDVARMRGTVEGTLIFDDLVRIWGMTLKLDNAGAETFDLLLAPDESTL